MLDLLQSSSQREHAYAWRGDLAKPPVIEMLHGSLAPFPTMCSAETSWAGFGTFSKSHFCVFLMFSAEESWAGFDISGAAPQTASAETKRHALLPAASHTLPSSALFLSLARIFFFHILSTRAKGCESHGALRSLYRFTFWGNWQCHSESFFESSRNCLRFWEANRMLFCESFFTVGQKMGASG